MASHTFIVELLVLLLERSHCMGVSGVHPYLMFFLVTTRTRFDTDIRRVSSSQEGVGFGGSRRLRAGVLLVGEFGMGRGDNLQSRGVIRYVGIQRDVAIDLILGASVSLDVYPKLSQILGLVIGVGNRRAIEVLSLIHAARLACCDYRINLRVLGGQPLSRTHIHISQGDDEVRLLL